MKPQRAWTNLEVETLVQMIADGKSGPEIGLALGRTRNAVAGKAVFLGLKIKRTGGGSSIEVDPRVIASDRLRERILDAFVRVANDTGLNLAEVQAHLLGREPTRIPGAERHMKTCQVERLAA